MLVITDRVSILGENAANTIIDSNAASRVVHVDTAAGQVHLNNVAVQNGSSGVCNCTSYSIMDLDDSIIRNNHAGGVKNHGTMQIYGTLIQSNTRQSADFIGLDTFTYTITDTVITDTAAVTVTVQLHAGPTAVDDQTTTQENTAVLIDVLTNDIVGDLGAFTLDSIGTPVSGTAVINGTQILYSSALDFIGTDTFAYTITDTILTDSATVTVTVEPVITTYWIYLPAVLKEN
ncbi:MAG: hypothetical protein GY796_35005 [Chloroflexi bacterium]|nr:hypothetical protein [Chloroflexota bacterium]